MVVSPHLVTSTMEKPLDYVKYCIRKLELRPRKLTCVLDSGSDSDGCFEVLIARD